MQLVGALDHHTSSGPLARRILSQRLSQEVNKKEQQLKDTGVSLKIGQSYRDVAFSSSVLNESRHRRKLREGDRFSALEAGTLTSQIGRG